MDVVTRIIPDVLPAAFGVTLLTLSLILTLAPWLSGVDFGILKIPQLPDKLSQRLKFIGPLALFLSVALHIPLTVDRSESVSDPTVGGDQPGDEFSTPDYMVLIPGGSFTMGSTSTAVNEAYKRAVEILCPPEMDLTERECLSPTWKEPERPDHTVFLAPYYIDIYEVTEGQYRRYDKGLEPGAPDINNSGADRYPHVGVSWQEADDYCRKLGKGLPTEAQWEKAARSAKVWRYPWGDYPVDNTRANYCDSHCPLPFNDATHNDGYGQGAPVGSYEQGISNHGVYDLAGNVAEWVADWYNRNIYSKLERAENPRNKEVPPNQYRVVRGGSFNSHAEELRATFRIGEEARSKKDDIGFRCAQDAPG